jgi:3-oxoacyl-[acyl-carrier protein] reductase
LNYADDEANAALTLAVVRNYGVDAVAIQADVSKVDDVEHLFIQTLDRFGILDIVVANASMEIIDQPILEAMEEQFDRLFAVNTKGAFFTL